MPDTFNLPADLNLVGDDEWTEVVAFEIVEVVDTSSDPASLVIAERSGAPVLLTGPGVVFRSPVPVHVRLSLNSATSVKVRVYRGKGPEAWPMIVPARGSFLVDAAGKGLIGQTGSPVPVILTDGATGVQLGMIGAGQAASARTSIQYIASSGITAFYDAAGSLAAVPPAPGGSKKAMYSTPVGRDSTGQGRPLRVGSTDGATVIAGVDAVSEADAANPVPSRDYLRDWSQVGTTLSSLAAGDNSATFDLTGQGYREVVVALEKLSAGDASTYGADISSAMDNAASTYGTGAELLGRGTFKVNTATPRAVAHFGEGDGSALSTNPASSPFAPNFLGVTLQQTTADNEMRVRVWAR